MKAVKYIMKKMYDERNTSMEEIIDKIEPITVEILVVDSIDILDPWTKVKLKMNHDNNGKSIKVMMKDDGEWKRVAYVRESDAINLMQYEFLDKKLMFIDKFKADYKYRILL